MSVSSTGATGSIGIQTITPKSGTSQHQWQQANDNANAAIADEAAKQPPPPPGMGELVDKTA